MHIPRILAASAALSGAILLGIGPAFADSPHFIKSSASITNSGDLNVSFKEAGLGNNQLISYVASASAVADYGCINHGGNHPQASNKETVSGPVSAEGTFSSGKNGTISQTLTLHPPGPGDFTCPGNQTLVLADVTYTNVSINDTTNTVSAAIPGTFTKVFFTFS
ncbi:hypothetical protein [Kitasatospora sp. KL5]|uniref:hypothetical protein n=1 Tax=Kitasatospora sp. KL5 TaxID=3425125 RepID=UPI003D6EB617